MPASQPNVTWLIAKSVQTLSPWVTIVSRVVSSATGANETFHSIAQSDYVSVLAVTADGRIPLVRQLRPAVERVTLELPGGIVDAGRSPQTVAEAELYEETGFTAASSPLLLGRLSPDPGRLDNSFWCYYVNAGERAVDWCAEANVEPVFFGRSQLRAAILDGEFDSAMHIGLIGLAIMRGCFSWEDS